MRSFFPVRCAFLPRTPWRGIKECNSDGELGTVCSFSCNEGYELKGDVSTTCHRDEEVEGMGKWDNKVPTCERKYRNLKVLLSRTNA